MAAAFAAACDPDELLCKEGSWGPLCGACKPLYIYSVEMQVYFSRLHRLSADKAICNSLLPQKNTKLTLE